MITCTTCSGISGTCRPARRATLMTCKSMLSELEKGKKQASAAETQLPAVLGLLSCFGSQNTLCFKVRMHQTTAGAAASSSLGCIQLMSGQRLQPTQVRFSQKSNVEASMLTNKAMTYPYKSNLEKERSVLWLHMAHVLQILMHAMQKFLTVNRQVSSLAFNEATKLCTCKAGLQGLNMWCCRCVPGLLPKQELPAAAIPPCSVHPATPAQSSETAAIDTANKGIVSTFCCFKELHCVP